jgi:hypothetical protein
VKTMLAHQEGWDEILLTAGLVLAVLAVSRFRRRAIRMPRPPLPENGCQYCGAAPEPGEARCPSCGFRRPEAAG